MKIINLGIANFKSFDSEGILIENLSKINIFIGKNNSGKSNILKFLHLCSKAIQKVDEVYSNLNAVFSKEFNKPENYFKGIKKDPEITISIGYKDFPKKLKEYTNIDDLITFKINLLTREIIEKCKIIENLNEKQLYPLQNKYSKASKEELLKVVNEKLVERTLSIFYDFVKRIKYIPDFRQITEQEKDTESNIENGQNIISEVSKMQSPEFNEYNKKEKFNKMRDFLLKELLEESDANIDIPYKKNDIILNLYGHNLPYKSFGTGVHELLIICKVLALTEKSIVCIEEPEIHLHPYLQRKFIELMNKTDNIYFITTHSNVFLDSNQNTSIYHAIYDRSKTSVSLVNSDEKCYSILEDLGFKASDLLQTNGIIWVEGPSDRIYLKKWIELLEKDFIEGIHYTIMFYGGKLLSHVSMKYQQFLTDEFISLLRINKNAMIIIDSDKIHPQDQINVTKKRIENEAKNGTCWITKGREIENYLTKNTINIWLKNECQDIAESEIHFIENKNKKLEELINNSNKKINIKYNLKKVEYAKKIIESISNRDLDILDFKDSLGILIKNIKNWNYI